ncbi:Death Domain-Containing Protein Cradd [Manis pentadactyla]|nr:Death Domain-Containing Protein Cradd [Manis pentadactyla]
MAERGPRLWFYSCEWTTQREKEKRSRQLSEIAMCYKEKILRELNVYRVLPHLVYDGMFSLQEYSEVLSQDCYGKRIESFFLKLCSKGPKAFCAFCSHLEDFSPYLLTCFFLYYQEQTHRILRDASPAEAAARAGTQPEPGNALETEDGEQVLILSCPLAIYGFC